MAVETCKQEGQIQSAPTFIVFKLLVKLGFYLVCMSITRSTWYLRFSLKPEWKQDFINVINISFFFFYQDGKKGKMSWFWIWIGLKETGALLSKWHVCLHGVNFNVRICSFVWINIPNAAGANVTAEKGWTATMWPSVRLQLQQPQFTAINAIYIYIIYSGIII